MFLAATCRSGKGEACQKQPTPGCSNSVQRSSIVTSPCKRLCLFCRAICSGCNHNSQHHNCFFACRMHVEFLIALVLHAKLSYKLRVAHLLVAHCRPTCTARRCLRAQVASTRCSGSPMACQQCASATHSNVVMHCKVGAQCRVMQQTTDGQPILAPVIEARPLPMLVGWCCWHEIE